MRNTHYYIFAIIFIAVIGLLIVIISSNNNTSVLLAGAQFGRDTISQKSATACTDSDNGEDYFTRGTCSSRGRLYEDHCISNYSDWWDSGWLYRKEITIENDNIIEPIESEYTVALSINHELLVQEGKSFPDGNDLRIIYNGEEIDRANGSAFNSPETFLQFKTQNTIIPGGNDTYFLYYGAIYQGIPKADPKNVYLFYDDFNDGDISDWSPDTGTWKITDGYVTTDNGDGRLRHSTFLPEVENRGIQYWFDSYPSLSDGIFSLSQLPNSASPGFWVIFEDPIKLTRHQSGYNTICSMPTKKETYKWYSTHVTKTKEGFWTLSVNDGLGAEYCSGNDNTDLGDSMHTVLYSSNRGGGRWDNVRFGKYIFPEPTLFPSTEETLNNTLVEFSCSPICAATIINCNDLGMICNNGSCIIPPTHLACINSQCVVVDGDDIDECSTDSDCSHLACSGLQCIIVGGQGEDECYLDKDCPRHLECHDNTCTAIPGPGNNDCSTEGSACGPDLIVPFIQIFRGDQINITPPSFNITVLATIENIGFLKAEKFYTEFTLLPEGGGKLVYTPNLNPGSSVNETMTFELDEGDYMVSVNTDYFNTVFENNETNNHLTLNFTV